MKTLQPTEINIVITILTFRRGIKEITIKRLSSQRLTEDKIA